MLPGVFVADITSDVAVYPNFRLTYSNHVQIQPRRISSTQLSADVVVHIANGCSTYVNMYYVYVYQDNISGSGSAHSN